ncbi:ATP-binding protein [Flexithrix dorotheae]|uniref:ATP-binding protein n=1 Tax=Flexithrix dorotheae TaxID=70993 RepID=UPI0004768EF5|nr:ATP-binding protein [Flexithrix dorotheae]
MNKSLKLKIPSMIDNIRIVESFIDNAKETFKFNDDIYGNIMIAVTESVNNAIVHGNKNDKNKNVHLSLSVDDSNISFVIKDEGKGFNHKQLPDPTAPENLDNPGGRGIFLIRHLADEVKFNSNGKEIKMIFYVNT